MTTAPTPGDVLSQGPRSADLAIVAGVVLAVAAHQTCYWVYGLTPQQCWVAAVTALCAAWWLTQAVPIAITSLTPFIVFPLAGVADAGKVAEALGDRTILLFMGGFMLSKAAEHHGTHVQMADRVLRLVGTTSNPRIVLAFLITSASLSMWISNTATTLIMLPVGLAVLARSPSQSLAVPLMLSIAYGASIGGLATPIGTPPNLIFMANYEQITGKGIPFVSWMMIGIPISLALLGVAFAILAFTAGRGAAIVLPPLQRWTKPQILVLIVFACAAMAWMTRVAPYGGWQQWLGLKFADDYTVALVAVLALFLIPSTEGGGRRLLNWTVASSIPWGLLLLFAGGIALARGFRTSELDLVIGRQLAEFASFHPLVLIAIIALVVTFLTEIANNTAVATLLMPLLGAVAVGVGIEPALMMIPAAISASCAFMLPVATAPNAIIFSSDRVTIPQMAARGLLLNLAGTITNTLICYYLLDFVLRRLD